MYGTYLGKYINSWNICSGVDVDENQIAYITGHTSAPEYFPITPTAYQTTKSNNEDNAFLIKIDTRLSETSSLIYGTYLGGNRFDRGSGVAVDNDGVAYITGSTYSDQNFPLKNAYSSVLQGSTDAFLIKLDTKQSGTNGLLYGTYLGGNNKTDGSGIAINNENVAYITGSTRSTSNFPLKDSIQSTLNGTINSFVVVIDTNQTYASSLLFGTYIGGNAQDSGASIDVDSSNNIYIVGSTNSNNNFPIINAYQNSLSGSEDAFLTKIGIAAPTDLVLEKTSCKCEVCINEKLPYTLTVTNNGPNEAVNIVVTDIIPFGVYVYSVVQSVGTTQISDENIIWNIPLLTVGAKVTAIITFIPTERICFTSEKYIINQSSLKADNQLINLGSSTSSVVTNVNCYCCKKE